jgi:hypothetical protein
MKNDVNVPYKSTKQANLKKEKNLFLVGRIRIRMSMLRFRGSESVLTCHESKTLMSISRLSSLVKHADEKGGGD